MSINEYLRRFSKVKKEDILHSSGYAKAQNREGFGTASAQSFSERRRIAKQRRMVGRYQDTRVAQQMDERQEAHAFSTRSLKEVEGSPKDARERQDSALGARNKAVGTSGRMAKLRENIAKPDIKPHF